MKTNYSEQLTIKEIQELFLGEDTPILATTTIKTSEDEVVRVVEYLDSIPQNDSVEFVRKHIFISNFDVRLGIKSNESYKREACNYEDAPIAEMCTLALRNHFIKTKKDLNYSADLESYLDPHTV